MRSSLYFFKRVIKWGAYLAFSIILIPTSCTTDSPNPDYPAGSNNYINNWVLESMKVYYYWNTMLPSQANLDLKPLDFFSSIKYSDDRFSRLTNPALRESYFPSLVHNFGLDLIVFQESSGAIKTVVVLVVPGSQAEFVGLQRGSVIKNINGIPPSGSSIAGMIETAIAQRKIVLDLEGKGNVTLGTQLVSENPVYLYKTFDNGGKSVGYLFYNSFEGRSKYDLHAAFASFKSKNITELIIDLRYNPGGDMGMCAALAAVLSNVNETDIFVEYRGNSKAGIRRDSFAKTISSISPGYSFSFDELKAMRLHLNRVFILTGTHTGSAAEFLIKGLRPWTNVIQVGASTRGKDMASFTITDSNTSKNNNWNLELIIFKLYNSNSEGDYPSGLTPDIATDEFSGTIVPFGDIKDPLVKSALSRINGLPNGKTPANTSSKLRLLYDSRQNTDKTSGLIQFNGLL